MPARTNGPSISEASRTPEDTDTVNTMSRVATIAINLLPPDTTRVELLTFIIKHNIVRDGDFCDENLTTLEILNDLRIAVGNYPFKTPTKAPANQGHAHYGSTPGNYLETTDLDKAAPPPRPPPPKRPPDPTPPLRPPRPHATQHAAAPPAEPPAPPATNAPTSTREPQAPKSKQQPSSTNATAA